MRTTHVCPKCDNNRLLEIGAVPDTGEYASEIRELHLAIRHVGDGWAGDEKRERAGRLTAMMCRECGYAELYVADPASVRPDGKYVREVVGPDRTKAPYR